MPPARRRTDRVAGSRALAAALAALDAGAAPTPADTRTASRYLLEELAAAAPGRSVEVRVPPYGVVQCVGGPRHTRGTPPSVVETDPLTWLALATGRTSWAQAVGAGKLSASGERSDLREHFPLA